MMWMSRLRSPAALRAAALRAAAMVLSLAPAVALADGEGDAPASDAPATESAPAAEAKPEPKKKDASLKEMMEAAEKPAAGATSSSTAADANVPPGGRLDWAVRRQIMVYQKRDVLKEARHAFTLGTGVVPNDDFFVYPLVGAGYQYFFSEDLALDVHAAYAFENQTSLRATLEKPFEEGGPNLGVRLPQALVGYATAGVNWYFLHGKLGFFSTRLTEFDLSFNFGLGAVMTKLTAQGATNVSNGVVPAGEVGVDLMVYLTKSLAMRAGFRQNFYPADDGNACVPNCGYAGVSYPISATLALTYFTEAPQ